MYMIGEFSRMSRVPVKTLRYYDEIGLLTPVHVDPDSGYRMYSPEQIVRVQKILALKDLGLSLNEIREFLASDPSSDQIRGMLKLKQAELRDEIDQARDRLSVLETHQEQVNGGCCPTFDVVQKDVEPLLVASIRRTVPTAFDQIGLWESLTRRLENSKARVAGPPISLNHDADFREENVDIEVSIPIVGVIEAPEPVCIHTLPAVRVASIIHHGADEDLGRTYWRLIVWILSHGFRVHVPTRWVYLRYVDAGLPVPASMKHMLTKDPEDAITEIQLPISRPSA